MRKSMVVALVAIVAAAFAATPAFAGDPFVRSTWQPCTSDQTRANPWTVDWSSAPGVTTGAPVAAAVSFGLPDTTDQTAPGRARPVAFEYSDGYKLRAKIHKVASIATLPLFVAEYLVGTNLYNNPLTSSGSARSAHSALAASTAVLFGVNTVTGVWNLIEASKDPNRRTKRTVHGILMLIADAGFVATGATAPHSEHGRIEEGGGSRSTHRTIAITSMGIATVSYLMMLFGGN